ELFDGVALDVEAAQQREALTIYDVFPLRRELPREVRQREFLRGEFTQLQTARFQRLKCNRDITIVLLIEMTDPILSGKIGPGPCRAPRYRRFQYVGHLPRLSSRNRASEVSYASGLPHRFERLGIAIGDRAIAPSDRHFRTGST